MWIHCTKSWSIVDLEHCWYMICYLNKAYGNLSKSRNEIPTWGRPPGLLVIWCMVASHLSCTLIEKFLLYSKRSWIMMDDSGHGHPFPPTPTGGGWQYSGPATVAGPLPPNMPAGTGSAPLTRHVATSGGIASDNAAYIYPRVLATCQFTCD